MNAINSIDSTLLNPPLGVRSIPFHLVTGFLGSGKTTFLKEFLSQFSDKYRIAVVQNEFAESGIDGKELQESGWKFDLLEVNKGSVFCVCLFSDFRSQLNNFVDEYKPDVVVLEATGLADPIAISELLMDTQLQKKLYLAGVWTVIDAVHYQKVKKMPAVMNQILIADTVLVNKMDLISAGAIELIKTEVLQINPLAQLYCTTYCQMPFDNIVEKKLLRQDGKPVGAIKDVYTQVFRTSNPVKRKNVDYLIKTLNEDTYRLKGYIVTENNEAFMIQSVFGQTKLVPVTKSMFGTEIISIGRKNIDFDYLLRKMVLINK